MAAGYDSGGGGAQLAGSMVRRWWALLKLRREE
jgi:hypothetical protein